MSEPFININLDDVDDGTEPHPEGTPVCNVHSIIRKQKAGSDYPYYELTLKPDDAPNKTLWLNLSLHPKALFNIKLYMKAMGLGNAKIQAFEDQSKDTIMQTRGRKFAPTVSIIASQNDPDRKVNEVKPPYHAVR